MILDKKAYYETPPCPRKLPSNISYLGIELHFIACFE